MSTKKDRQYFVKEVKDICTEQGLILKPKTWDCDEYENDKLTVSVLPQEHHQTIYFVAVKFKTPCAKGNPHSGKYNFISVQHRVKIAVADFEDHLIDALCTT